MPGCTKAVEHVHFAEDSAEIQVIADQVKILVTELKLVF
jgi:hypothetical protein